MNHRHVIYTIGIILILAMLSNIREEQIKWKYVMNNTLVKLKENLYEELAQFPEKMLSLKNEKVNLNELTEKDQFVKITPHLCRKTRMFLDDPSTVADICVKPIKTDKYVSGGIAHRGAWEGSIVTNVVRALHFFPDATFIDIGCNIGMYTVVAASMKRKVVAVDADPVNLAYVRRSIDLGKTTHNVRLIHNSVSNDHTQLYLDQTTGDVKTNLGGTHVRLYEEMKKNNIKEVGDAISSVTLMEILSTITADTVIMKLDIESYECKALTFDVLLGKSGKKIPLIFLEWGQVAKNRKVCPEYEQWVETFYKGGYTPHYSWSKFPNGVLRRYLATIWDLVWVHEDVDLTKI